MCAPLTSMEDLQRPPEPPPLQSPPHHERAEGLHRHLHQRESALKMRASEVVRQNTSLQMAGLLEDGEIEASLAGMMKAKEFAAKLTDRVRSSLMLKRIAEKAAEQEHHNAHYRDQAGEDFYSTDALKARRRLQRHDLVQAANKKLHAEVRQLAAKMGLEIVENRIPRPVYRQFYWLLWIKMGSDAEDDDDQQDFIETFFEDWSHDVGAGEADMNFAQFASAMFELADHWCDSLEPTDYVGFIDSLDECCSTDPPAPPEPAGLGDSLGEPPPAAPPPAVAKPPEGCVHHRCPSPRHTHERRRPMCCLAPYRRRAKIGRWDADASYTPPGSSSAKTRPPPKPPPKPPRTPPTKPELHTHKSGLLELGADDGASTAARKTSPKLPPPPKPAPFARPPLGGGPRLLGGASSAGAQLSRAPPPRVALGEWRQQFRLEDFDPTAVSLLTPPEQSLVLQYGYEYAGALRGGAGAGGGGRGGGGGGGGGGNSLLPGASGAPGGVVHDRDEAGVAVLVQQQTASELLPTDEEVDALGAAVAPRAPCDDEQVALPQQQP